MTARRTSPAPSSSSSRLRPIIVVDPRHSAAAAIILDRPTRPPAAAVLPDKCFHINSTGPDGAWFHVECTTDLRNWTPICTNQVVNGSIDFVDPDAQPTSSASTAPSPSPILHCN